MLKNVKFIHVYKTSTGIYTSDSIAYFQLEKKEQLSHKLKDSATWQLLKLISLT